MCFCEQISENHCVLIIYYDRHCTTPLNHESKKSEMSSFLKYYSCIAYVTQLPPIVFTPNGILAFARPGLTKHSFPTIFPNIETSWQKFEKLLVLL